MAELPVPPAPVVHFNTGGRPFFVTRCRWVEATNPTRHSLIEEREECRIVQIGMDKETVEVYVDNVPMFSGTRVFRNGSLVAVAT